MLVDVSADDQVLKPAITVIDKAMLDISWAVNGVPFTNIHCLIPDDHLTGSFGKEVDLLHVRVGVSACLHSGL